MKISTYIPGLAVPLAIAVASYFFSLLHASIEALLVSLILGMFIGNILRNREVFTEGINFSIKTLLPMGIAFYGSQLFLRNVQFGVLAAVFMVFLSLFGLTMLTSSVFNISRKMSLLLATGLSICGASAIAVLGPLIGAKRSDISISVISVMMLGLTGMIFYPIANDFFSLTEYEFNFLAGTTLPMIGQVRVAAANVCPDCITSALELKVIRVSFLLVLFVFIGFFTRREGRRARVPWFVVVFLLLAGVTNLTELFDPIREQLKAASNFFLSTGLAAIGFSVDFDSIIEEGVIPLSIIFIAWIITLLLIYIVRSIIYV